MKLPKTLRKKLETIAQSKRTVDASGSTISSDQIRALLHAAKDQESLSALGGLTSTDLAHILFSAAPLLPTDPINDPAADGGTKEAEEKSAGSKFVEAVERQLDDLPKRYELIVPLAFFPTMHTESMPLGDFFDLVSLPKSDFELSNQPVGALTLLAGLNSNLVTSLRVRCSGYLGASEHCSAYVNGMALAREFLYLATIFGWAQPALGLNAFNNPAGQLGCVLIRASDEADKRLKFSPRPDFMQFLSRLEPLDWPRFRFGDVVSSRAGGFDRSGAIEKFSKYAAGSDLYFKGRHHPDLREMQFGIEWAFTGLISEEPSTALVHSFIALEALLGDATSDQGHGQREQVSARLSDRYAMLVGTARSSRPGLRQLFRRVYQERSKIMHGRLDRARLEADFSGLRLETEHLVAEVVRHELRRFLDHTQRHKARFGGDESTAAPADASGG